MTSTTRRKPKFDTVSAPISEMPSRAVANRRAVTEASLSISAPADTMTKHLEEPTNSLLSAASIPIPVMPVASRTGPELIDQIIEFPTLDVILDRDPHARPYTDQELEHLVQSERSRRAIYQTKLDKAASKRQGLTEPEKVEETGDE